MRLMKNMNSRHPILLTVTLILAACTDAQILAEHDHNGETNQDISKQSLHDKYGHMSAIYLCGDEQLQTSHTAEATKLAYKGEKIDVIRKVTIIDQTFAGETFEGTFAGQSLLFTGKGDAPTLTIGDQTQTCEKLSCIPMGGPA